MKIVQEIKYEYNEKGKIIKSKNCITGIIKEIKYDDKDNVVSIKDNINNIITFIYNKENKIHLIFKNGIIIKNFTVPNDTVKKKDLTKYIVDNKGRVISSTNDCGTFKMFGYNNKNQLINKKVICIKDGQIISKSIVFTYNENDKLIMERDIITNNRKTLEYGNRGNLIRIKINDIIVKENKYNESNNLVKVIIYSDIQELPFIIE